MSTKESKDLSRETQEREKERLLMVETAAAIKHSSEWPAKVNFDLLGKLKARASAAGLAVQDVEAFQEIHWAVLLSDSGNIKKTMAKVCEILDAHNIPFNDIIQEVKSK